MKIWFEGDITGLKAGIEILTGELGVEIAQSGAIVKVEKTPDNIHVTYKDGQGFIGYKENIHFFRAFGLLVEGMQTGQEFAIKEEPQFEMNGAMFDVSRNAVMKVESIKRMLRQMALMGLNTMMLYTEDTYTIKSRPYFGYMRGRYTAEELRECDDYAYAFGIEIIPCIQTLAHLMHALKWHYAIELRDTEDILLSGNNETYKFIEEMIVAASEPFRSRRIHLGMDEAHNLGLGRYLELNGYRRRFDIMNEHLNKVVDIATKFGLKPMIWSDMYFRLGSKTGDYYDLNAVIPDDVVEKIPAGLQLVLWDYYHNDEAFFQKHINLHQKMSPGVIFAGGVWTWTGFGSNYGKTFATTNPALAACKSEGVKEVFATVWMDNCAENNFFSTLLGLQLFAEHGYATEIKVEKLKKRFEFCSGGTYDAFMALRYIDETPGVAKDNLIESNPGKFLLWQDILMGFFDKNIAGYDMKGHYSEVERKFKEYRAVNKIWDCVFEVPEKLCHVLALKSDLSVKIKEMYDKREIEALKEMVAIQLPELSKRVEELRLAHRTHWMNTYKPFGWEVMDIRYGGLQARIDTAQARLEDYIAGKIDRLEEIEAERLLFEMAEDQEGVTIGRCNYYHRAATACSI